MAKTNVTTLQTAVSRLCAPTPFAVSTDSFYLLEEASRDMPALQINPVASIDVILSAAQRRAESLHKMLRAWACASQTQEVTASDIAEALEPAAEEIKILLQAALSRAAAT